MMPITSSVKPSGLNITDEAQSLVIITADKIIDKGVRWS